MHKIVIAHGIQVEYMPVKRTCCIHHTKNMLYSSHKEHVVFTTHKFKKLVLKNDFLHMFCQFGKDFDRIQQKVMEWAIPIKEIQEVLHRTVMRNIA